LPLPSREGREGITIYASPLKGEEKRKMIFAPPTRGREKRKMILVNLVFIPQM